MSKNLPEDEVIGDLKKQFYGNDLNIQRRRKMSPSMAVGGVSLGYHRGIHVGVIRAFNAIAKEFPEVKEKFPRLCGFDMTQK